MEQNTDTVNAVDEINMQPLDLELLSSCLASILADYHKVEKPIIMNEVRRIHNTVGRMIEWQKQQSSIGDEELNALADKYIKEVYSGTGWEVDIDTSDVGIQNRIFGFKEGYKAAHKESQEKKKRRRFNSYALVIKKQWKRKVLACYI